MARTSSRGDGRGGTKAYETTGPDFRLSDDPWKGEHNMVVENETPRGTKFRCDGSCGKPGCSKTDFIPE